MIFFYYNMSTFNKFASQLEVFKMQYILPKYEINFP